MPALLPHTAIATPEPPDDGPQLLSDALSPDFELEDEFVEMDPSNRYGRYSDLLGKGATKRVYRAFDTEQGIEVAWNQARLHDIKLITTEVQLLTTLKHKNIIKLYNYWVDIENGCVNFITELCSGTLLDYRKQHKHICMRAVKDWARQILRGLAYLHSQDPPVIHRDLKCENIFINCCNGKVKIGDFGFATVLQGSSHVCSAVGTPEFMAPEMFEEDYNELVDVYAFGMCMLQLLTLECPYSECKSLAQVYKKATTGVKPKALEQVKDFQALIFINKCLAAACQRPSVSDLQSDPFLQGETRLHLDLGTTLVKSASVPDLESLKLKADKADGMVVDSAVRNQKLTAHHSFKRSRNRREMQVSGNLETEFMIQMKLQIVELSKAFPVRHIEFQFDLQSDTPESVADEMVEALDFPYSDSIIIAHMIASLIATLIPEKEDSVSEATSTQFAELTPEPDDIESVGYLSDLAEQQEPMPTFVFPVDISQQTMGNQLCLSPSHSHFGNGIPSFLKASA